MVLKAKALTSAQASDMLLDDPVEILNAQGAINKAASAAKIAESNANAKLKEINNAWSNFQLLNISSEQAMNDATKCRELVVDLEKKMSNLTKT